MSTQTGIESLSDIFENQTAEIARLTRLLRESEAERDAAREDLLRTCDTLANTAIERDAARAEAVARERDAGHLRRYAKHHPTCNLSLGTPCSCGLDAALAKLKREAQKGSTP